MFGKLLLGCNGVSDTSEPTVDLTNGLVAHYLLNNNADDCRGDYDGIPTDVNFQGDSAQCIKATPSQIEVAPTSTAVCVSLWTTMELYTGTSQGALLGQGSDTFNCVVGGGFTGDINGETLSILTGVSKHCAYIKTEINDNSWKHIVIEYHGSATYKFYINGVEQTVYTYSIDDVNSIKDFTLIGGGYYGTDSNSFDGNISNVRTYNDVKDQAFIDELYAEGYYPKPLPLPTTEGLVAYYPLTGTAEDDIGDNNGTENGNTYTDDTEKGSVASFDGVDDYIKKQSLNIATSEYAFVFWAKGNTKPMNGEYRLLFRWSNSYDTDASAMYYGGYGDDVIRYFSDDTSDALVEFTDTNISNKWNFYVVRAKLNDFVDVFVNTIKKGTTSIGDNAHINNNISLTIGNRHYDPNECFNGNISNFRIYDRAITEQEITDIYNYEKNFRTIDVDDGLVAYYPLKQNSMDNYYNQYDGGDTGIIYDGASAIFDNGDNNSIAINVPISQTFSISFFVNISLISLPNYIFWFGSKDAGIKIKNDKISATVYDGTEYAVYYDDTTLDQLVHIVVTLNSDNVLKMYANGVECDSINAVQPNSISTQQYIGFRNADSSMRGYLSNFRIYNKAIIAEQVKIIYNTEKGDFI